MRRFQRAFTHHAVGKDAIEGFRINGKRIEIDGKTCAWLEEVCSTCGGSPIRPGSNPVDSQHDIRCQVEHTGEPE